MKENFEQENIEQEQSEKIDLTELIEFVNELYESSGEKKEVIESLKEHNQKVLEYLMDLAPKLELNSDEVIMAVMAAALHDAAKLVDEKGEKVPLVKHGFESARIAREKLRETLPASFGLTADFIEKVSQAIERHMGPIPGFMAEAAKKWEKETGEKIEFPRPETLVEKAVYDADMLALMDTSGLKKIIELRKNSKEFRKEDEKIAKKLDISEDEVRMRSALKSAQEAKDSLLTRAGKKMAEQVYQETSKVMQENILREKLGSAGF